MNKSQVVKELNKLECDIAEVICDISINGRIVYPNQSILVSLVSDPCNDDLVQVNHHWSWYECIDDFEDNVVYGERDARKAYCEQYVSKFKSVNEFISDFK